MARGYLYFPDPASDPGLRPQFLFDGPITNFYLAALTFNLYLLAPSPRILWPSPGQLELFHNIL